MPRSIPSSYLDKYILVVNVGAKFQPLGKANGAGLVYEGQTAGEKKEHGKWTRR